ncbi:MAG: Ig-like domain-containing protein [Methanomicrobiaceae archaeon]|nr:Ig-like domain-containing protein [Methanomicrobiaceae archaeon]
MHRLFDSEEGVSVIVGTLLLILITVTAAAGLAVMVSEYQKEEMERQDHLQDVENEELRIMGVIPEWNGTAWNDAVGSSNEGNWSSMKVALLNMNVQDSRIAGIKINDRYAEQYTWEGTAYDLNKRLFVPAKKQREVTVSFIANFTAPYNISETEPVHILVLTSLYNTFEQTFQPPVAVAKFSLEAEDLTVADRQVLILDGSDSFDDGTIQEWSWAYTDGSDTYPKPGTWADTTNITSSTQTGKVARIYLSSEGPFRVVLTVTDDTGMKGTAVPLLIPASPRFNPPTCLAVTHISNELRATITDIFGNPAPDIPVTFLKIAGNVTCDAFYGETGANGMATINITAGEGIIRVQSGKIPSVEKAVKFI